MKQLDNVRDLEKLFVDSVKDRKPVALYIEMPGFPKPELITNPVENLDMKLEYYKNTYDSKLEHRHAKGIKIIGYKEQKGDIVVTVVTVDLDTYKLDEAVEKLQVLIDTSNKAGGVLDKDC